MILQLPNELVSSILSHLDGGDLKSARLICHRISHIVIPIFSQHFFTEVECSFLKSNIERLEVIASSEELRNVVCHLKIEPRRRFGEGLTWPRHSTGKLQEGQNVKRIRNLLADSFPNLTKLHIVADAIPQIPNYWTSEEHLTLPDILEQVFIALALSTHPIQSFGLDFTTRNPKDCLQAVSHSIYESDSFWEAWSKLKALRLVMGPDDDGQDERQTLNLIIKAQGLEKLALDSCLRKTHSGATPLYDLLMAADTVPKLTHLEIVHAHFMSPERLVSFLKRFQATLQFLTLDYVFLRGDWKDACEAMKGQFPKLKVFILRVPQYMDRYRARHFMCPIRTMVPDIAKKDFTFTERSDVRLKRQYCVTGVRYAGSDVDSALGFIQKSIYCTESPPDGLQQYKPTSDPNRGNRLLFNDQNFQF